MDPIENFGRALRDCSEAIRLNRKNVKAFYRTAKALQALERFGDALQVIKLGLEVDPENAALKNELKSTEDLLNRAQELEKKRKAREEEKAKQTQLILDTIKVCIFVL